MNCKFKLLSLQMVGCAVLLLGNGSVVQAQSLPLQPILLTQSAQSTEADALYSEAMLLFLQGTEESYRQAIEKWQIILSLYGEQRGDQDVALINYWLGSAYSSLGEKQEAIAYYEKSLAINKKLKDYIQEAMTLDQIAGVYNDLEEKQKAIDYYLQALSIRKMLGHYNSENPLILATIATLYSDLGKIQQALDYYLQALSLSQVVADQFKEVIILKYIAGFYSQLGEQQQALDYLQKALSLSRVMNDPFTESSIFTGIGKVYSELGDNQQALDYYQQALLFFRTIDYRDYREEELNMSMINSLLRGEEATVLNNIAGVYSDLGEKQQALDYYQQSLSLSRAIGDRHGEAVSLSNIGQVYSDLGEKQQAIEYLQQALPLSRELNDRRNEATMLDNIAGVYSDLGEKQQALDFFQQALSISREMSDRHGEAFSLTNIGAVYDGLGEKQQALDYYNQALPLLRAVGDRRGEASNLQNIGLVYDDLGEQQQALDYYNQALFLSRAVGDRGGEAVTLINTGKVYYHLGERQKALDYYNQALFLLRAVGNRAGEAVTLANIGRVYSESKEKQKALDYYNQALPLSRAVGDRETEASTLDKLGSLFQDLEQPELAIIFYKQSVNLYESLRNDIKGLDRKIQETYLGTVEQTYRRLADLLLQQNRVFEAQRVLDLLKVQELDDLFENAQVRSSDSELGIFHRSPETAFLERYNAKLREEIALGKEYIALQTRNNSTGLSPTEENRFLELQARQTDNKNTLTAFLNDPSIQAILEQLKDYIEGDNQAFDTEQISQLRNKFKAIQDQGKNAALLYPLILDDRLELVLTTSLTTSIRRTVDISRTDLNKLILAAGQTLKNPSDTNYQALEELYEVLITPIEAALDEAKIETLVYAPDGALRYLPLAALRNPSTGQWLIDKYQVNNITALSLTNFGQDSPQNLNVLAGAFANGNYDLKVQVSNGQTTAERTFPFSGLTHAGEEVAAITNLARTKPFLDADFSKKITEQFNLHNVIHLATHAQFLPETPKDSFLVFGNGEYATLREMESQWGELTNNQLFVLSACETALGTDFAELSQTNSGIEILGLGYQLQNKGARAIMASLWQVKDKSTQVLMTEFYQRLSRGESTVEALRQAQATLSQSEEYGHPHHWASFVVIGNGL